MEVSRPMTNHSTLADNLPVNGQTSDYSSGRFSSNIDSSQVQRLSESGGRVSSTYGQRQTEMRLKAADFDDLPPERTKDYKGRIRTWPGLLLLLLLVGGAAAIILQQAMETSDLISASQENYEQQQAIKRKIKDGMEDDQVLISDDGQVGNPKKYPDMGCELPDYQSKNGEIVAVSKNGTEVPVGIKGTNWFGMETGLAIPFGLWENIDNGTSVYEVAAFLARNNFNSVRLPLCIKNILKNVAPEKSLINMQTNRAIKISSYISTIQSIVEALGYRHVSVLISLHTLDPKKSGGAWFSEELDVTEDEFLEAVDILTKNLCGSKYWNILGLDLKNEPHECTWGGKAPDWQKGATLIGNRMLEGCPNWLAFVEGIASKGTITLNGIEDTYFDWWGGGLADAGGNPPIFDIENKLVWSPHYYNTGVNPAWYLYASGTQNAEGGRDDYVELDNKTLRNNVEKTMEKMFGYLLKEDTNTAMVMGEFAGLYAKDVHPMLTTKRTSDYTLDVMLQENYAGAYMWSLNPESAYQFNPADTFGHFTEGLLQDDWLTPNKVFVDGMSAMDVMKNLQLFPCFPEEKKDSSDHRASLVVGRPGERLSTPWKIEATVVRNDQDPSSGRGAMPFTAIYSNKDHSAPKFTTDPSQIMRLVVKKPSGSENESDYKGQHRIWPGLLLLFVLVMGSTVLIITGAMKTSETRKARTLHYEQRVAGKRSIKDGKTDEDIIISDDGQVGNPKSYDTSITCEMPDYQSKNGQIVAVAANGTEISIQIKGVNWFGMETALAVPFGLWENTDNGTTAYEIAAFLARNNFNAVRVPVSIENVLNNSPPQKGVINLSSNRAINGTDFISTLQTITKALAYRKIGVLISMHRLTNKKSGATWFDEDLGVTQDDFLNAVDIISSNLCGQDYWNVMGIDLKNEPETATWGTGDDDDFVVGCEKIAKVMHGNCPQWLGFVEGVVGVHTVTIDDEELDYYDWWGGGLQKAGDTQPEFTIENKVVWAPHYYTTAVAPQRYFYGDKTTSDFSTYVELSDKDLLTRVEGTMYDMFGYLVNDKGYALLLGEFAGLYTKDAHPKKTTKRTTDLTIQVLMENKYAGGFMWSLNPESEYQYNPADTEGSFTEGMLLDDWLSPNNDFLDAFIPMDAMPNLRKFPCFPIVNEDE
ncbi:unnamed protein product [Peronospora effusa]|nr:unnamed protein product [Peronospora effusa]